jgi:hypothetical protein
MGAAIVDAVADGAFVGEPAVAHALPRSRHDP